MARTRRILRLNDVLSEFCMPLRPRAVHPEPYGRLYARYTYYILSSLFPYRARPRDKKRTGVRTFVLSLKILFPFVVLRQRALARWRMLSVPQFRFLLRPFYRLIARRVIRAVSQKLPLKMPSAILLL